MATVKATLTIDFKKACDKSVDSQDNLTAELDEERNVNENGDAKSCFKYGEKVYFRVRKKPFDMAITIKHSAEEVKGKVYHEGDFEEESEEDITFESSNEASTDYYIESFNAANVTWKGNSLGNLVKVDDSTLQAASSGVAVASVKYKTKYSLYSLVIPTQPDDEWAVVVVITGVV